MKRNTRNNKVMGAQQTMFPRKSKWYFLGITILIYLLASVFNFEKTINSIQTFQKIFIGIIPTFIIIILIMTLTNYFAKNKKLIKLISKQKGWKGWITAIISGTLSSGPIYMWYPLLKDLKKHGVKTGLLATFLYNRSIKLPFIPLIITYFGMSYTIILMITIMSMSIAQGWVVERILQRI